MPAWLARIPAGRVAQLSGLVFIPAGLVKFVFHAWELKAFRDFGIPAASLMEPLVGVLETLGGLLLLRRTLILPTAVVLAVIMLVAFVAGGLIHGSPIPSDTLAPALLVAMAYLILTTRRALRD
ncbi:MAG TPA: DoxX family membrane protein [Solirubrobacteraceae bacterium]|nr:DoxX family membrane protein [Solirubrobacteraceae bacterium]